MAMSQTVVEKNTVDETTKEKEENGVEAGKTNHTSKLTSVQEEDETQLLQKDELLENNATSTTTEDAIEDPLISKLAFDKVDFIRVYFHNF